MRLLHIEGKNFHTRLTKTEQAHITETDHVLESHSTRHNAIPQSVLQHHLVFDEVIQQLASGSSDASL